MFGADRFAAAAPAHQNHGLVPATVQHVPVGHLPTGVDVGRHVFLLTALEDVDHLGIRYKKNQCYFLDFNFNKGIYMCTITGVSSAC